MDIYASDEEKAEEIKQWWRDNGRSVIVGCLLGAVAIFAGRYWFQYQDMQRVKASLHYQQVIQALQQNKPEQAQDETQTLFQTYSHTPYAVFAALQMAKHAVKAKENNQAEDYLRWAAEHAKLPAYQAIAHVRLARLYLASSDFEAFFALAKSAQTPEFGSIWDELKGDAYTAQGKRDAARKAYQSAMLKLPAGSPRLQMLQIKRNDVTEAQDG